MAVAHTLRTLRYTHLTYAHTYIHTSISCSFSQEGRMCCQHVILLLLLSSPPYLCAALLKMINCYFWFALCKTSPSLLWSSRSSNHIYACGEARGVPSQGSSFRRCSCGCPSSDQAVRLDPARAPVALSSAIATRKKAMEDVQGKKVEASEGNLDIFRALFFLI